MYDVLGWVRQIWTIQWNFGTPGVNGMHELNDISTSVYYGSQITVVAEIECSKPVEMKIQKNIELYYQPSYRTQ